MMLFNRLLFSMWVCVPALSLSCAAHESSLRDDEPVVRSAAAESANQATTPGPRVLIVSFDGLRPDAISPERMPNLTGVIEQGSYHPASLAELPCITLPNHTSMVTGLSIAHHGVLLNSSLPGRVKHRTIFDEARDAHVSAGFFVSKPKLRYLCEEKDVDAYVVNTKIDSLASDVSRTILAHDLRLMFVHFGEPDGAGHAHGWMSDPYLEQVAAVDAAFGRILNALEERLVRDETVIIVTADHGGEGRIHGFDTPLQRSVPFVVQGPGMAAGRRLCDPRCPMDVAATALNVLGLSTALAGDGRVVEEASEVVAAAECEEPIPVYSVACGPMPVLVFVPLALYGAGMRFRVRRRVRVHGGRP